MRIAFAIPGDLETRTGGYAYDRALMAHMIGEGAAVTHLPLPGTFPHASDADIDAALAALGALPADTIALVDGLAYAVLPAERLSVINAPLVALVHHPLADETGLSAHDAKALAASETAALAKAHAVVTTSETTATTLATRFGVPRARISVVLPGLSPAAYQENKPEAPPSIVAVGTLIPRKGFDTLLAALALLGDLAWTAHVVGSTERHAATAKFLRTVAEGPALAGRVQFHGECGDDTIRALFAAATVFCLPSRHEGFGMVYAEAMAAGLPVIGCTAGAVPEVVPDTAGILVPVGDHQALAAALRLLIVDRDQRERYAAGARARAATFPSWADSARKTMTALSGLLPISQHGPQP